MPKAKRSKDPIGHRVTRVRGRRPGWVRKAVLIDQRKLDAARQALGLENETETIDQALDMIAFGHEITKGIAAIRRDGIVEDLLEEPGRLPIA